MQYKQNKTLQEFDRLNRLVNELYHEIAVKQGISDSAYSILQAMLILGNGNTQTDICKYTCLNKQTVNSSVKKLKQNGLIEFHQGNGREMKIYLTSKGQYFINENILPIEQAENEVFDEMTIQEQREILRLIENYLSSFRHKIEKLQGEK